MFGPRLDLRSRIRNCSREGDKKKDDAFAASWKAGSGIMKGTGTKAVVYPVAMLQMSTMIGWSAADTIKESAKKDKKADSVPVSVKRTIARMFTSLVHDNIYVSPAEENDDVDVNASGILEGGSVSVVCSFGPAVRQTIHQADMYNDNIGEDGWNESYTQWADNAQEQQGPRLPSFRDRLAALGLKNDSTSKVRMVMFTSPPFGWGLSLYDSLPEDDDEQKVIHAYTITHTHYRVTSGQ